MIFQRGTSNTETWFLISFILLFSLSYYLYPADFSLKRLSYLDLFKRINLIPLSHVQCFEQIEIPIVAFPYAKHTVYVIMIVF